MKKLLLLTLVLCAATSQALMTRYNPIDNNGKPMIDSNRKVVCQELISALHNAAAELQALLDSYSACIKTDKVQRVKNEIQELKTFEQQENGHLARMQEYDNSEV